MTNSEINALHNEAMDLYEQWLRGGKTQEELIDQAYSKSRQVADEVLAIKAPEPSRSVFLRSAAWLAFHSRRLRDAERYLCLANAGDPPLEILIESRRQLLDVLAAIERE